VLLGLWLMATGRVPAVVESFGQDVFRRARARFKPAFDAPGGAARAGGGARGRAPWWLPLLGGMAWALLPCGLLYAAVMTAALAPSPQGGALVMLCFALPGAVGVWAAPAVLAWLRGRWQGGVVAPAASTPVPVIWLRAEAGGTAGVASPGPTGLAAASCQAVAVGDSPTPQLSTADVRWAVRLSGAMLAAMASWGAYHLVMAQWRAWCA
jgi:hypothetical protein